VDVLHQHFARGTKDRDWLPAAGARGWVVITVDVHVRLRPGELCRHARKLRPPVIGHVRADGTVVILEGERRAATKRD
jgi:hypothetical protein